MSKNNIQRLKDEADIASVIAYLGIETKRKGSCTFILCPNPGHDDKHPDNCYFKPGWNNVLCRACNTSINAVDLIMYTRGISYGEAADLLWEISGRPDWYYAKKKKKNDFSISVEEQKLIGLHLPTRIQIPVALSSTKDELSKNRMLDSSNIDGYLQVENKYVVYTDFADKRTFMRIIFNRTTETLSAIRNRKKHESDLELIKFYSEYESKCLAILARLRANQTKIRGRA